MTPKSTRLGPFSTDGFNRRLVISLEGCPRGGIISVTGTTRNLQSDNYIGKMTLALQMSHQPPLHASTLCPETMPTEQPSANDLVSCGGLPSGRKCTDMRRQILNLVVSYIFH